jgi:uncharacterized protein (DUF1810 family)
MPAFDLERFVTAQREVYPRALAELRRGRKESHWMWFVFPQLAGLGASATARRFAIASADEARAYHAHPLLGMRLREAGTAMLAHDGTGAATILGDVDAIKLHSSMTLFEAIAGRSGPFERVLDAFFGGARDRRTLALLAR